MSSKLGGALGGAGQSGGLLGPLGGLIRPVSQALDATPLGGLVGSKSPIGGLLLGRQEQKQSQVPGVNADMAVNQTPGATFNQSPEATMAVKNTIDTMSKKNLPQAQQAINNAGTGANKYYSIAQNMIGLNERKHGDVLQETFKKTLGRKLDPRKTAWCAGFVNSVLASGGNKGTGSLMARSFLNFGSKVEKPTKGDIVVLQRGAAPFGHVGFFAGYDEQGNVKVLGGNQSNGVNIKSYNATRVLGYRRPPQLGD